MNQNIVQKAINQKMILDFTYNGHHRIVEPHVLGVSHGVVQFLGYQIDGTSNNGKIPDWRRFELSKISELTITNRSFLGKRNFPSGKHSDWDRKIAIVT